MAEKEDGNLRFHQSHGIEGRRFHSWFFRLGGTRVLKVPMEKSHIGVKVSEAEAACGHRTGRMPPGGVLPVPGGPRMMVTPSSVSSADWIARSCGAAKGGRGPPAAKHPHGLTPPPRADPALEGCSAQNPSVINLGEKNVRGWAQTTVASRLGFAGANRGPIEAPSGALLDEHGQLGFRWDEGGRRSLKSPSPSRLFLLVGGVTPFRSVTPPLYLKYPYLLKAQSHCPQSRIRDQILVGGPT